MQRPMRNGWASSSTSLSRSCSPRSLSSSEGSRRDPQQGSPAMTALPPSAGREPRLQLIPIPRSIFMIWVNLAAALIVAAIGFGVGFGQGMRGQEVILATVITVAVLLWLLNYIVVIFETRNVERSAAELPTKTGTTRNAWRAN